MTWGPEDSFMGVKVAKLLDSLADARRAGVPQRTDVFEDQQLPD